MTSHESGERNPGSRRKLAERCQLAVRGSRHRGAPRQGTPDRAPDRIRGILHRSRRRRYAAARTIRAGDRMRRRQVPQRPLRAGPRPTPERGAQEPGLEDPSHLEHRLVQAPRTGDRKREQVDTRRRSSLRPDATGPGTGGSNAMRIPPHARGPRTDDGRPLGRAKVVGARANSRKTESPQTRVGRGGASWMPPQQRNSIEMSAPCEWKP